MRWQGGGAWGGRPACGAGYRTPAPGPVVEVSPRARATHTRLGVIRSWPRRHCVAQNAYAMRTADSTPALQRLALQLALQRALRLALQRASPLALQLAPPCPCGRGGQGADLRVKGGQVKGSGTPTTSLQDPMGPGEVKKTAHARNPTHSPATHNATATGPARRPRQLPAPGPDRSTGPGRGRGGRGRLPGARCPGQAAGPVRKFTASCVRDTRAPWTLR